MSSSNKALKRHTSWLFVLAAALVVFAFGLVGFREHFRLIGEPRPWLDLFYLTGQLFTIESGAVDGPVPWQLEIARFGAPLVAASAVVAAVFALFSIETRRWLLRLRGGHVIVCGLGRTGGRLVEELRREGRRVAVIEPDEHNPGLARCRALKVVVVSGRSDDGWALSRALVERASMVIATSGTDSVNIETAVLAHDFAQSRPRGVLRCVAHLADPALQQLLKAHPIFEDPDDPFELELVNVYEAGARIMLERAGLAGERAVRPGARLCVVGFGLFGEAVLRRVLRDWTVQGALRGEGGGGGDEGGPAEPGLKIVVVDLSASRKENSVRQRYRDYLEGVELSFVDRDVRSPEFAGPEPAVTRVGQRIDAFFVCFDDDSLAAIAALRIRERFVDSGPVIARMAEGIGLTRLLHREAGGCGRVEGICPVAFSEIACMRDLFLGGDVEVLGRAFHEAYLEERAAAGDTPEQNTYFVPWHELKEEARESNRRRATETSEQLSDVGLVLVSCPGRPVVLHRFSDERLDKLASIEHGRWLAAKREDGWRFGPERDHGRKLNPLMVPWEELGEADKTFNVATVRRLPAIVARADFEIRAVEPPACRALPGGA